MSKKTAVGMDRCDFLKHTVMTLEPADFEGLKDTLLAHTHIAFSIVSPDMVTQAVLAEKLCDYFKTIELLNKTNFSMLLEEYCKNLCSLVESRKGGGLSKPGKKEVPSRAWIYYNKAVQLSEHRTDISAMIDFTRIVLCLYTAIIAAEYKEISDFNFAADSLNVEQILCSFKSETTENLLKRTKHSRFEFENPYSKDSASLVIAIILLHKILNDSLEGETKYE